MTRHSIPSPSRPAVFVLLLGLAACGSGVSDDPGPLEGEPLETPWTKVFRAVERDGYRVVDIEASVVTWGGTAGGPPQRARLVLVPRGQEPPPLTGDLAGGHPDRDARPADRRQRSAP